MQRADSSPKGTDNPDRQPAVQDIPEWECVLKRKQAGPGPEKGKGRNSTVSTTEKMAAFRPIQNARAATMPAVTPGPLRTVRNANFRSLSGLPPTRVPALLLHPFHAVQTCQGDSPRALRRNSSSNLLLHFALEIIMQFVIQIALDLRPMEKRTDSQRILLTKRIISALYWSHDHCDSPGKPLPVGSLPL